MNVHQFLAVGCIWALPFSFYTLVPLYKLLTLITGFSQDSVILSWHECTDTPHWRSWIRRPRSPSLTVCLTSITQSRFWLTSSPYRYCSPSIYCNFHPVNDNVF